MEKKKMGLPMQIFLALILGIVVGLVLMMPTMLLSGMIFPIESMPVALQVVAEVIPARWYIEAVRKVMIAGMGWSSIWTEFTVLCGMAIALLAASLGRFKIRLA